MAARVAWHAAGQRTRRAPGGSGSPCVAPHARAPPRLRELLSALPCVHASSELDARTDASAKGSAASRSSAARRMRAYRRPVRAPAHGAGAPSAAVSAPGRPARRAVKRRKANRRSAFNGACPAFHHANTKARGGARASRESAPRWSRRRRATRNSGTALLPKPRLPPESTCLLPGRVGSSVVLALRACLLPAPCGSCGDRRALARAAGRSAWPLPRRADSPRRLSRLWRTRCLRR